MICLVTGVAGFIGSSLAERLVKAGHQVRGIDSLSSYYSSRIKLDNISWLRRNENFTFEKSDLATEDIRRFVRGVDSIFHLAAQPGVRSSWGSHFSEYVKDNIAATQKLLEGARGVPIKKFVYASSSSIYGDSERFPTSEVAVPSPNSPYGVTKLAGEHLCRTYHKNFDLPVVVLRYFTVYGPRQRPEMAFHKFIAGISNGSVVQVYGNGSQARDFTYIDDTVTATVLALKARPGSVFNVGAGKTVTLNGAIRIIESILGKKAKISYSQSAPGDVRKTSADVSRIRRELGYIPKFELREGLKRQVDWQLGRA